MTKEVLFDSMLRCRSGKLVPYWDTVYTDTVKPLMWFHEGYGTMRLYRLHDVDGKTFIAEYTGVQSWTEDPLYAVYSKFPQLAMDVKQGDEYFVANGTIFHILEEMPFDADPECRGHLAHATGQEYWDGDIWVTEYMYPEDEEEV